jgi:hypothetical protein
MAGALIIRHVLELEPLVSLSADELTARLTPAVQGHLDGSPQEPTPLPHSRDITVSLDAPTARVSDSSYGE